MMQILGRRRVGQIGARDEDGIGGFGEEKRLLACRIAAHLAGVGGIIAPDTENAPHREQPAALNGHRGLWRRRDDEIGHFFALPR
jgi:hypothetical protein